MPTDTTSYDETTLDRAREALRSISPAFTDDAITALQNAGILFRERDRLGSEFSIERTGEPAWAEALTKLTATVDRMLEIVIDEHQDGSPLYEQSWGTKWYVFSPERGHVEYKSEESAHEGGRYWLEHSSRPGAVEVYSRETKTKVYERNVVPPEAWRGEAPLHERESDLLDRLERAAESASDDWAVKQEVLAFIAQRRSEL